MDDTDQAAETAPTMLCEHCWGVITPGQRCWMKLRLYATADGAVESTDSYEHEVCP